MDTQQEQLVQNLEIQAEQAKIDRDRAHVQLQTAEENYRKPPRLIFQNHLIPLAIAGLLGFGGFHHANQNNAPLIGVLGAGAGLGICLKSKAMDEQKQLREKTVFLTRSKQNLAETQENAQQAVAIYTQEEINLWLMYNLSINREELSNLSEWSSDVRREMKDDILEAITVLNQRFYIPLPAGHANSYLANYHKYHSLEQKINSVQVQQEKNQFIQQKAIKYSVKLTAEQTQANLISAAKVGGASVVGGTAAGLAAGVGVAALSAGAVKSLGGSKEVGNVAAAVGGAAAVIGVGILAAKAIGSWFSSREEEKKQLQEQYFRDAFLVTGNILNSVKLASSCVELQQAKNYLMTALNQVQAFEVKELTTQDQETKNYVSILRWQLITYFNN